ncbi:putative retrotransposon gag domain-containing protein [Helianthus debilis subsp. tardiflorus]
MVSQTSRLDAHEQQIHQLQSDVAEIKASLTTLNEDRAESAEFRKVVLAWMKSQEKKHMDDSLGSGSSGMVFSTSGPKSDSSDPPSGLPWAVKKVKLPEFSGFDPQGWIQKANLFFDLNQTPDASRLQLAQLSMIGVAQHWFTVLTQVRPSLSWLDFQSELLQRFSGLAIQNPYEQLATIQQSDSIYDFIDDFEYLLSLVPRLPESQVIGYFLAGLKDDVKPRVRLHRPTSLIEAMSLAKDVELILRPSDPHTLSSRFRYSQQPGLPLLGYRFGHRLGGNSMFNPAGNSPLYSASGQAGQRDRGVRSLSRTEWEERRKKGQCYKCGQPYSPTHTCPNGKLRVMLLGDDEPDGFEGLHFQLEHMDHFQSDGGTRTAVGSSTKP